MTVSEEAVYIEEENIGLDLHPITFDSSNKRFYAISGKDAISFDVDSGHRVQFFRHSEIVIGLHFINKKFFSITQSGIITQWNVEDGTELSKASISPERYNLLWSYEVESVDELEHSPQIWIYAQKMAGFSGGDECDSMEVDESSSDNSICHSSSTSLFRLDFHDQMEADDSAVLKPKLNLVLEISERIASKRHMAVSTDFVVIAKGCELEVIPFSHFKGKINGPLRSLHTAKFEMIGVENVAFDEVLISDDIVVAGLNYGRIYFWNKFRECGLGATNKSFQNASNNSFVSAAACGRSVFTGDGVGALFKWNLTSGLGRWHKLENLFLPAPVERLLLSADNSLLLTTLADNSVFVVRTATMTTVQRCKVLEWNALVSPLDWAKLTVDPAKPECIVGNARLGHIQWIEPAKWRTISKYDISEENAPPRDNYNVPNFLWMNVYLVHLTATRMITCECRRNDFDKTYLKIYRRVEPGSISNFRLEECVLYPRRIAFIRTNSDESTSVVADASAESDEVLRIDSDGLIDVFVADTLRVGRWRLDANRRAITWRKSKIQSCSRVRFDAFATVNMLVKNVPSASEEVPSKGVKKRKSKRRSSRRNNSIGDEMADTSGCHSETDDDGEEASKEVDGAQSFVLLWQLPFSLRIFQIIECVPDAKQVEWAPPNAEGKSVLLICATSGICGYNPQDASIMWKVEQTGFSLFSSRLTCFAFDSTTVIFFDAISGDLKKVLRFKNPQIQIIASGSHAKNIRLCGLSERGISVLKPDTPENAAISDVSVRTRKTPFSELLSKSTTSNEKISSEKDAPPTFVELQAKIPLASKIFDGPAYTLAPLMQIAPLYIRSCLIPKRKPD